MLDYYFSGVKMFDQKEAYEYKNYMANLKGARIKVIPFMQYTKAYSLRQMTPYKTAEAMAQMFTEAVMMPQHSQDSDDLFAQKLELTENKTALIIDEIKAREGIKYDNLKRLYKDLNRVENWRLDRPFPDNYLRDKTWSDLNKMELSLHDQIRRELKDATKDIAYPTKDLRESLLEFKLQNQKANMLKDDSLELMVESGVMEPDGSNKQPGDLNQFKNIY